MLGGIEIRSRPEISAWRCVTIESAASNSARPRRQDSK